MIMKMMLLQKLYALLNLDLSVEIEKPGRVAYASAGTHLSAKGYALAAEFIDGFFNTGSSIQR
jgi:hypothetical protein